MNTEMLIIAIIVFILLFSIFIGIINWVLLAATSSKIATLEGEIEKKTKEFDAIKKERQLLQQSTSSETPSQPETPSIEIVRNVRPGFQSSTPDGQSLSVSPAPPSATYENQAGDVLDVVDENAPKVGRQSSSDRAITIALFSSARKDTDFSSAWKQLSARLPTAPRPRVILDFENVIFLYDKELQYLEKIRDVILSFGGNVELVNCHDELRSVLSKRPALAGCIV